MKMKIFNVYLAGEFVNSTDYINVNEKFSQTMFAKAGLADEHMLKKAIAAAVHAEKMMFSLSSSERFQILKNISNRLFEERDHFAEIIAKEAGKPMKYALTEVERAAQTFLIAAEESKRIMSELISLDWFTHGKNKEALVKLFPVGTVAGITPFNFPLNLVAHKVAPAIAAGCPVIIKPASATPVSTLELARIIHESGLPKGAFSALPMSHEVSKPLIYDERIKKISFTGSPQIGWKLKNECGQKKITLELGGNAAAVITPGADMLEAVNKCVTGAFAYSGQVCIHTQRIFVQKEIFRTFLDEFLKKVQTLKYGNPLDIHTDVSVMIDEGNSVRVHKWISEAVEEGAHLEAGGGRTGNYIEPTVLTNTNPLMKVRKHEVFGPVVTIDPYDEFQQAVDLVNDSEFGLQAGIFTDSISEMNTAFRDIRAGAILVNESPTYRIDHMPYGGMKNSGFGREGVKYAIHEMCEIKVLLKPF